MRTTAPLLLETPDGTTAIETLRKGVYEVAKVHLPLEGQDL